MTCEDDGAVVPSDAVLLDVVLVPGGDPQPAHLHALVVAHQVEAQQVAAARRQLRDRVGVHLVTHVQLAVAQHRVCRGTLQKVA